MSRPQMYQTPTSASKSSYTFNYQAPGVAYRTAQAAGQRFDSQRLPSIKGRKVLTILAITTTLSLALVIPLAIWLWYVFFHETTTIDIPNRSLLSTASPTRLLLLSTTTMQVAKASIGLLMSMHAYVAAADWLGSSVQAETSRLPTPIHLGTLISLYEGSSTQSLFFAYKGRWQRDRRHLAWPPAVRRAARLLAWLVLLSLAFSAVDTWIHFDSSSAESVPSAIKYISPAASPTNALYSRDVNRTLCASFSQSSLSGSFASCGLQDFSATTRSYTASVASRILTNNSDDSRAVWLNDGTAILAPASAPINGYKASALGIRSVCQSITTQCASCNGTQANVGIRCDGSQSGPTLLCRGPIKFAYNSSEEAFAGPLSRANGTKIFRDFGDNPLAFGAVVDSSAYSIDLVTNNIGALDYYAGSTGFLVKSRRQVNLLYCDISVLDVTYTFTPPETYTVITAPSHDGTTAQYAGYGLNTWFTDAMRGFEVIDGAGQRGIAKYSEVYGRQLNKIVIATLARTTGPTPAMELLAGRAAGTRVVLAGIVIQLLLIVFMFFTIVGVGLHAFIAVQTSQSKLFEAARARLTSAYPLIGDVYGGLNHDYVLHKSAVTGAASDKAFLRESELDRLELVQVDQFDGTGERTITLVPRRL